MGKMGGQSMIIRSYSAPAQAEMFFQDNIERGIKCLQVAGKIQARGLVVCDQFFRFDIVFLCNEPDIFTVIVAADFAQDQVFLAQGHNLNMLKSAPQDLRTAFHPIRGFQEH